MKTYLFLIDPIFLINADTEEEAFDLIYNLRFKDLKFGFKKEDYRKRYAPIEIDTKTKGIAYKGIQTEIHEGF